MTYLEKKAEEWFKYNVGVLDFFYLYPSNNEELIKKAYKDGYEQGQKDFQCSLVFKNNELHEENEELKKSIAEKNSVIKKEKAQIKKMKKIMQINDYCENVYHYLTCELDLYKADEFDCEVCRYTECSKRLKPCELE